MIARIYTERGTKFHDNAKRMLTTPTRDGLFEIIDNSEIKNIV